MTETLCHLGYTEREAAFLVVASLQSGYFVRSQFNAFIGRECGAIGQHFIERSIQLGHVVPLLGYGHRLLYHIGTRSIYTQLGETDNRNRREHQPETVRHRLLMLDYVIGRPAETWLLTDKSRREALSRIAGAHGSSGWKNNQGFLHRSYHQPISLDLNGLPRFAFVDAGVGSFSEWESFLRARRSFLLAIGQATIIYATCDAGRSRQAHRLFRRIVAGQAADGEVDRERLRAYFTARQLFEQQRYQDFDQAKLDQLREDRRVYAGPVFERLYDQWRQDGEPVLIGIAPSPLGFESQPLPEAYAWLNPIRFHERRAHHGPDSSTAQKGSRGGHR